MDRFSMKSSYPTKEIFVSILNESVDDLDANFAYRLSGHLAGRLRQVILAQELDWEPLSERWLKYKIKKGWDTRILRATGAYVNSIQPRKVSKHVYKVAPSNRKTKSGATLHQIGSYLEYGTVNADGSMRMPARPHWRPVWEEFLREQGEIVAEMKKHFVANLVKEMKKRSKSKVRLLNG